MLSLCYQQSGQVSLRQIRCLELFALTANKLGMSDMCLLTRLLLIHTYCSDCYARPSVGLPMEDVGLCTLLRAAALRLKLSATRNAVAVRGLAGFRMH